jgi:hypothetical protein
MDKNIRVGEVKQDKVLRWFPSCQWVIDRNPHQFKGMLLLGDP